jgi:hypothetical protein
MYVVPLLTSDLRVIIIRLMKIRGNFITGLSADINVIAVFVIRPNSEFNNESVRNHKV